MNLHASKGNFVVIDDGKTTQEFPITIGEDISFKESYTFNLGAGATKDIYFNGPSYGKGVMVNSNNMVAVGIGTKLAEGENIYLNKTYAKALSIKNLGRVGIEAEVESAEVNDGKTTLTIKDSNFVYSTLTSTPVSEPFNVEGLEFTFKIANHVILYISLYGEDGADMTTGDGVASSFEKIINENLVGFDLVEVEYNDDDQFVIKCLSPGPHTIEFLEDDGDNRIYLGMSNPTLELGCEDFTGQTLNMINGAANGENAVITSVDNTTIIVDADWTGALPVDGDHFYVTDLTKDATVSLLAYQ